MIGLLRKDLYVADKSGRMLLVMAVVFSVIPRMGRAKRHLSENMRQAPDTRVVAVPILTALQWNRQWRL